MIPYYLFSFFTKLFANQNRFFRFCIDTASLLQKIKNKGPRKIPFTFKNIAKIGEVYKLYKYSFNLVYSPFFLNIAVRLFHRLPVFPIVSLKNITDYTFHNVRLSKAGI